MSQSHYALTVAEAGVIEFEHVDGSDIEMVVYEPLELLNWTPHVLAPNNRRDKSLGRRWARYTYVTCGNTIWS